MMSNNASLNQARTAKQDEFYTQLVDIEKELKHYQKHFKNKVVFCNCDDPRVSNFFHYFSYNFEKLKLKKLITTCYKSKQTELFSQNDSDQAVYLEYTGDKNNNKIPDPDEIGINHLKGDGDFRSDECIEILKKCDIVVTNPPFSLFRDYVSQLVKYKKKFIIIGNQNAISYREIFKIIKANKMWLGNHFGDISFKVPDHYEPRKTRYWKDPNGQKWRSLGTACWFTNLDFPKRHENMILYKKYNKADYPKFDNYNAININKTKEIPINYKGMMAVPITFMDKFNPDQFEIIDGIGRYSFLDGVTKKTKGKYLTQIGDKKIYARIIIKHKMK